MTTRILARRLTVDHHGLAIEIPRGHYPPLAGQLTDSLIGDRWVDIWIDGHQHRMAAELTITLRRVP